MDSTELPQPNSDSVEVPMFAADGALSRAFLLRRGTCCGYGCKNCPYDGRVGSSAIGIEASAET